MTTAQWLFHYLEVMKFKGDEYKSKTDVQIDLIKIFNNRIEGLAQVITNSAKLTGAMANPESGKALVEMETINKHKEEMPDDKFSEWWQDYRERIPQKLTVEAAGDFVDLDGEEGYDLERMYEYEQKAYEESLKKTQEPSLEHPTDATSNNVVYSGEVEGWSPVTSNQ